MHVACGVGDWSTGGRSSPRYGLVGWKWSEILMDSKRSSLLPSPLYRKSNASSLFVTLNGLFNTTESVRGTTTTAT